MIGFSLLGYVIYNVIWSGAATFVQLLGMLPMHSLLHILFFVGTNRRFGPSDYRPALFSRLAAWHGSAKRTTGHSEALASGTPPRLQEI